MNTQADIVEVWNNLFYFIHPETQSRNIVTIQLLSQEDIMLKYIIIDKILIA